MAFFRKKKKQDSADPVESTEAVTLEPVEEPPEEPEQADNPDQAQEQSSKPQQDKPSGLFSGLAKTRQKLSGLFGRITPGRKIDDDLLDELEEELVTADLGVTTAVNLIDKMRGQVARKELGDADALKAALRASIAEVLAQVAPHPQRDHDPHVIMVVGVNGVGKTTTIGKLAHHFQASGRKVLLAAGDTFRAAASEQLKVWADRAGCEIVGGQDGADPSAVAYDAIEAGLARGCDLIMVDTAGRLHTKVNLMEELKKVHRVIAKRLEGAPHEVLLVLDASTGQNALSQVKLFNETVQLSGLVLTKLDGTAKGGVVVAIAAEMGLPICYVGVGEKIEDLRPFDPQEFAAAIV